MYNSDTIYANFTPIVKTAVIAYRISGPLVLKILFKLTKFNFTKHPNKVFYRSLIDENGMIIDKSNIVFFQSPYSFTGEDVAEIFIHGSPLLASHLEKAILSISPEMIRIAKRGEFSYRALINNKITLKQGQSINRIIMSDNIQEINYSKKILFNGDDESALYELKNKIVHIYSKIITTIDFADDESFEIKNINADISLFYKDVENIIKKNRTKLEQKNTLNVMIVGDVNVGKSTIFNKIIDADRAIVTNIKGTTRDIISENIIHDNRLYKVFDTAGYRKKQGKIELIGYKKATSISKDIDYFLIVFNASITILNLKKIKLDFFIKDNYSLVNNKSDILKNLNINKKYLNINKNMTRKQVFKNLKLVKNHKKYIKSQKSFLNINESELIFLEKILTKKEFLHNQKDILIVQEIIRNIIDDFSENFGYIHNEDILDNVFSSFCIGK
jgi:tRNA modification GTPase|tara:strand:+ start:2860 stop:4194 length:1335 start_codon:yes stop_codon:yes gene_type:complete